MNLSKQKQKMIDDYLQAGQQIIPVDVVIRVLIPMFEATAKLLKLENAYFWADPAKQQFSIIVLQNPNNPQEIKRTMYFFASEQDAKRHPHFDRCRHRIDKLPILTVLFQVLTIANDVDEAIFYHRKGRMKASKVLTTTNFIRDFHHNCEAAGLAQPVAKTAPFGLA
ncbi:MAG: hypothetical protein RLZZ568_2027 [Cyanobacteriota bacterium]|jgi:hypothetical protein